MELEELVQRIQRWKQRTGGGMAEEPATAQPTLPGSGPRTYGADEETAEIAAAEDPAVQKVVTEYGDEIVGTAAASEPGATEENSEVSIDDMVEEVND